VTHEVVNFGEVGRALVALVRAAITGARILSLMELFVASEGVSEYKGTITAGNAALVTLAMIVNAQHVRLKIGVRLKRLTAIYTASGLVYLE